MVIPRQIGSIVPRSLIAGCYATVAPSVTYVTLPENAAPFEGSSVDPQRVRLWLADIIMNHTARDILSETPMLTNDAVHMQPGARDYHFDGCTACRDQVYILAKHVKARSVPHKNVTLELDRLWWLPTLQANRLYIVNGAVDLDLTIPACAVVCILSTRREPCNFCCSSVTVTTPIPSPSSPSNSTSSSPSPTPSPLHASIASPSPTREGKGEDEDEDEDEDGLGMFTDETLEGLIGNGDTGRQD